MANALLTGVSGLQANQEMLNVVGNNLANGNTTGFKAQTVQFSDLIYQNLSAATAPSATSGGTNAAQVGNGVMVASIAINMQQGGLVSTGNALDMAIQGNGFFVANNGVENLYTRAGSFGVNANNQLIDPATGNLVQRFGTIGEGTATLPAFQKAGNDNITIPVGASTPGQATTSINFQGNLSANATGPLANLMTSGQPLQIAGGGGPALSTTLLNNLSDNTTPYVAGDHILISGSTAAGTAVSAPLAVGPATTVGDLVTALNADFPGSTAALTATGNIVLTDTATGPSKTALTITDQGTGGTNWGNSALQVTTVGKNGDTVNTGIQVYDTQGTAHNVNLVFTKQANNSWNLSASVNASDGTVIDGQVNGITFNPDGSFSQVTGTGVGDVNLTFKFNGLAAPQTMAMNFGTPKGFSGVTQMGGSSSAVANTQDGFASGTLSDVSVSGDGVISGVFTNGKVLPIAQLAVASFANTQGLSLNGSNYYSVSSASGNPLLGAGQSGGRGAIQQKTLESSNVDVSAEFTQMIVAQRAYQMNAKTVTVADSVLQTLANIIQQ